MAIGTLLHPTVKCFWQGESLHSQDVGGQLENMLQVVNISLENKQDTLPTLEFGITANAYGFKLYEKLSQGLSEPIYIEMGYRNSDSNLKLKFTFSAIHLTTGMNPVLKCQAVSGVKGSFTDNKVSTTTEDYMPLKEYPDFLKKLAGEGAKDLEFKFVGEAKEIAEKAKIRPNIIFQTPFKALQTAFRPHGINVQTSDSAIGESSTVVLSRVAEAPGEAAADPSQPAGGEVEEAVRKEYVIGLGLVQDITRTQKFELGGDPTNATTSPEEPMSDQDMNAEVAQPQNPSPQSTAAESYNETGTSGVATPGKNVKNLESPPDQKSKESAAANTKSQATEVSFQCLMVPYMCGIKPRDLVGFPTLKGPGEFVEVYEVQQVKYTQDTNGVIMLHVSATRDYTGEASETDTSKMANIAKQCQTVNDWAAFYWNQKVIEPPNYTNSSVNAARDALGPLPGQIGNTIKKTVSWAQTAGVHPLRNY